MGDPPTLSASNGSWRASPGAAVCPRHLRVWAVWRRGRERARVTEREVSSALGGGSPRSACRRVPFGVPTEPPHTLCPGLRLRSVAEAGRGTPM